MKKVINYQLWVKKEAEHYRIGLTNAAQDELGNVTFVQLPKVGTTLVKGQELSEVEAEKAVTEFLSPLSGKVVAINEAAEKNPSILDDLDDEKAWLVELSEVSEMEFQNLV